MLRHGKGSSWPVAHAWGLAAECCRQLLQDGRGCGRSCKSHPCLDPMLVCIWRSKAVDASLRLQRRRPRRRRRLQLQQRVQRAAAAALAQRGPPAG